jgi:hypothetical protein
MRWLVTFLVVLVVGFVAYTWIVLSWSYSMGERAGYVQKLSRKGWICKTWEGEIAMVTVPGTMTEKFQFSVRDDAVAAQINQSMGKRVSLTYEEHVGVPTNCFAETRYFVTGVRVVEEPHLIAPAPQGNAPPQAQTPPQAAPEQGVPQQAPAQPEAPRQGPPQSNSPGR